MQAAQPISFSIPARQYAALERRAGQLNIRAGEYARRLFDAAFSSRIAAERGKETYDEALDRAVRQAFLLADCEPDYIAKVIGAPVSWVEKIIKGWRAAAGKPSRSKASGDKCAIGEATMRPAAGVAASAQAASPEEPKTDPRTARAWPADIVAIVIKLWGEGQSAAQIGRRIGKTGGAVGQWIGKNRDKCPYRPEAAHDIK